MKSLTDTFGELVLIYATMLLIAAGLFAYFEGLGFWVSLYWAGTTATSTGYGDILPKTPAGMVLAFVLQHLSIFCVAPLVIVRLHERMIDNRNEFSHAEQEAIKAALERIEAHLNTKETPE